MRLRTTIFCTLVFMAGSALCHAAGPKGGLGPAEQTAVINSVRQYVQGYMKTLANSTCSLTVRHTSRPPNTGEGGPSLQSSVVDEGLRIFDGKEVIDQAPDTLPHDFDNLLSTIFDPATSADLRWDRTATLDHKKVDVLAFHVPVSAGYFLTAGGVSAQAPYEGFIYADAETHAVLRLQMKCTMIPLNSVIRSYGVTLDYKAGQLSGRDLVLPSHFLLQVIDSAKDQQIYEDGKYSAWRSVSPAGN